MKHNVKINFLIITEFGSIHKEIRNLNEENTNQNCEISLLKEKMESQDRTVHQKIIEELNKLLLTEEGHQLNAINDLCDFFQQDCCKVNAKTTQTNHQFVDFMVRQAIVQTLPYWDTP